MSITKNNTRMLEGTLGVDKLSATGTKDATTFLRGDNTFAAPAVPAAASNTPRFSVKKSQDQTGNTDNQFTQVTFETEEFDSEGAFASNRFTVPTGKGGIYSIGFNFVGGRDNQTKHVEAFINLNGSTNIAAGITDLNTTVNGYAMPIHLTRLVTLNEGDYIEFYAKVDTQDSGTATFYQTYSSAVACYAYGFKLA